MFFFLVASLLIAGAAAKPELTPQANGNTTPFYRPNLSEWRLHASVAYFKDKLYYLGGGTNRVDMEDGKQDLLFLFQLKRLKQQHAMEFYTLLMEEIAERYIDYQTMNGNGLKNRETSKSCLCFDPSAPVGSRISRIADMNYTRYGHSLIVANGKLYAVGGFQRYRADFCNSIEEYDPQANKWREVGKLNI
ncbi:hypothetical protein WR25_07439 [Diploscapter pachys]|uniref:Kelch repeat protein n=1 Tax=Diploscapter pachys TaxID=2018661 RepID=A0A2A2JT89_9BILA|nr:hypothetical protein WR25_07439 [Diploscapter pachys]